jgi:hypothetical protein
MSLYNPANESFAQSTKFKLTFDRLPYITFFCQNLEIPGLTVNEATYATPFVDLPVPGDKVQYEPLNINFVIDEDYKSWISIHDWLRGLGFPESFEEYRNLKELSNPLGRPRIQLESDRLQYSEAILTIFTNKNNPSLRIKFFDVFPVQLSSIPLNVQISAEEVLVGNAKFKFSYYNFE